MRLADADPGDLLWVSDRGSSMGFYAEFLGHVGKVVAIRPLSPGVGRSKCFSRNIKAHWKLQDGSVLPRSSAAGGSEAA